MNREPLETEHPNERTHDLDVMPVEELVEVLVRENASAGDAVLRCREAIAAAVECIVKRLESGGRLHYVGAGTSGRLGVLDAAECPPTFGTPSELVQAHIAGGAEALVRAVEGAEDDAEAGAAQATAHVRASDAVVGISASGSAAFAVGFVVRARELGAATIALTSVRDSPLERACEMAIVPSTGAEPLAGSTRMKAGTAQKIVLNAISTALMVRLGKVYDNLMVDVVATNQKLQRRAVRLVEELVPTNENSARDLLAAARGSVKVAVLMGRRGIDADAAQALLGNANGRLRTALNEDVRR